MSKLSKAQMKAAMDAKDAEIRALKIQVTHARDLTIHHMVNIVCGVIPHDDNCRDTLQSAIDAMREEEYKPVVFMPAHA
jgi:hypothetical protein